MLKELAFVKEAVSWVRTLARFLVLTKFSSRGVMEGGAMCYSARLYVYFSLRLGGGRSGLGNGAAGYRVVGEVEVAL